MIRMRFLKLNRPQSLCACVCAALLLWVGEIRAEWENLDLAALSLEELMDIEVFSVAKKEQRKFEAAAAISVITREEIRRSGVTSIPEALRLAPGLQVARLDASKWGLTARGFNGRYANKLLVMIDGRSIYTPLFAGVWWREYDVLLEDIERIEVVRGPGATLWGANAVNGVINILTRKADETQGKLVSIGGGSEERGFCNLRYGGRLGERGNYRVYGRYFDRDGFVDAMGTKTADRWDALRAGFRWDWEPTGRHFLTLQGEVADGEAGQTYERIDVDEDGAERKVADSQFANAFLLGNWRHRLSERSEMGLQVYWDRIDHEDSVVGQEIRNTLDVDFQHELTLDRRQQFLWGLRYRLTQDETQTALTASLEPPGRTDQLLSGFVQSDLGVADGRLYLTLGSKFEHNDYTGFEIQPNVRLSWSPGGNYSCWMAVARAVRIPSRAEDDARIIRQVAVLEDRGLPLLAEVRGNRNSESEELLAMEWGGRLKSGEQVSVDLALFYHIYDRLRSLEPGTPFSPTTPPLEVRFPSSVANMMKGETWGLELELVYHPRSWWRLRGIYSFLEMELELDAASRDSFSEEIEGYSPRHQVGIWSSLDLSRNWELDVGGRFVGALETMEVEQYFSLDARLGWNPLPQLTLSLVGQNLLQAHHTEFAPELINSVTNDTQRGLYGALAWSWDR
jgi:iron complex outermembrane recepter protein